jgi:hypothetical protein
MGAFSVRWIYELDADVSLSLAPYLQRTLDRPLAFCDREDREWLVLYPDGRAVIRHGYAWDGCTPKFSLFDIVIGVPDGIPNELTRKPKAYHASLVHDVLYQFLELPELPVDRRGADRAFLDLLDRDAFAPRYLYWAAVRVFGGLSRLFTSRHRAWKGRCVPLPMPATEPSAPMRPADL